MGSAKLPKLVVRELPGIVRALDRVTVRVARVAIGASELAADVRIDGPEIDARLLRRVEHGPRRELDELGAAETLI